MKEAKVVVAVYDENGKIATGVPVKMYNEKDYKIFEKDNLTLPTAIAQTKRKWHSNLCIATRGMVHNAVATVPDIRGTRRGWP